MNWHLAKIWILHLIVQQTSRPYTWIAPTVLVTPLGLPPPRPTGTCLLACCEKKGMEAFYILEKFLWPKLLANPSRKVLVNCMMQSSLSVMQSERYQDYEEKIRYFRCYFTYYSAQFIVIWLVNDLNLDDDFKHDKVEYLVSLVDICFLSSVAKSLIEFFGIFLALPFCCHFKGCFISLDSLLVIK